MDDKTKLEIVKANMMNPLWMPQGSIRAIIALSLLIMTGYLLYNEKEVAEWFSILVVSSVSFYFGTRKSTAIPE